MHQRLQDGIRMVRADFMDFYQLRVAVRFVVEPSREV